MTRTGKFLSLMFLAALGACGADSKPADTTPLVNEPTEPVATEPTEPAATEPTEPAEPPEPAKPPEPPAPTYLHGKWVWFELGTTDVAAATAFYGEVLGWTAENIDMNGEPMTMIKNGDKGVGLYMVLGDEAKKKKQSPLWIGYISVPDVDASVAAATEGGGAVVMPAMDLPNVGRIALLTDNDGATFGLVKTLASDEPDNMNPPAGSFVWVEHLSKDAKKAGEAAGFYAKVANYEVKSEKMGKMDYTIASGSGAGRMGFSKAAKSAWAGKQVPYIVVADVDATAKVVTKLKGKVLTKPTDIPNIGRFAMFADPQGAVFSVIKMAEIVLPAPPAPTGRVTTP